MILLSIDLVMRSVNLQQSAWFLIISLFIYSTFFILTLSPLHRIFKSVLNRLLYPEQEKIKKEFESLCNRLFYYHTFDDIFINTVSDLTKIFNTVKIMVFYLGEGEIFSFSHSGNSSEPSIKSFYLDIDDPIVLFFNINEEIKELKKIHSQIKSPMIEKCIAEGYKKFFPVKLGAEFLGGILIGDIKTIKIRSNIAERWLQHLAVILSQSMEHTRLRIEAKRESVEKGILIELAQNLSAYNGYDEDRLHRLSLKVGQGLAGWAIKMKKGLIIPDVSQDERYLNVRSETKSEMVVPLLRVNDVIGAFVLESNQLDFYSGSHYEILKTFASQAVLAIENARFYFEIVEKEKLEWELESASSIQRALLPQKIPEIPNYQISVLSVYSGKVGGDLYELNRINNEYLEIGVGDAAGKGIPGAILMATLSGMFQECAIKKTNLKEAAENVNNSLVDMTTPDKYITFFFATLNFKENILYYVNAGHNAPFLIKADKSFERLEKGGTVLGFLKNSEYKSGQVKIMPGDLLVLFTDGITEAENRNNKMYGEKRFSRVLIENINLDTEQVKSAVYSDLKQFSKSENFADDITIILRYYTVFKAGSRNEKPGKTGLSHLFEHLMFKGSAKFNPKEFDCILESRGGYSNAYTTKDMTVYYENFPPSLFETVVDLESDRMAYLRLNAENFHLEKDVVMEEHRVRVDDYIPGKLIEELFANAYTIHPYKLPVMGWMSDLENLTLEDCQQFYKTYYSPNNAIIILVGDFHSKTAKNLIKKYYGSISSQKSPPSVEKIEPVQLKEKRVNIHKKSRLYSCIIGYRVPGIDSPDIYALDVLKTILVSGDSSRLFQRLIHDKELIVSLWCDYTWRFQSSLFIIYVQVKPECTPSQVEEEIYLEIDDIRSHGVTPDEVRKAHNILERNFYHRLKTINEIGNQIAVTETLLGSYEELFSIPGRYKNVTNKHIQNTAIKYFTESNRTVVTQVSDP